MSEFAPRPVLVVACGNVWAGDDGIGPRIADALQAQRLETLEVVNLGSRPDELLDYLGTPRELLIVVDAVSLPGTPPGRLVDFDWGAPDRPPLVSFTPTSTHAASLDQVLDLAAALRLLPARVHLVGVTIGSADCEGQPSAASQALVTDAVACIVGLVQNGKASVGYQLRRATQA